MTTSTNNDSTMSFSNASTDSERVQVMEAESSIKKSKSSRGKKVIGCVAIVVIPFILVFALIVGAVATPRINDWLVEQGVDNVVTKPDDSEIIEDGDIRVVVTSEEKRLIDVIDENMQSVVSIAITEVSFSPDEGTVDRSNNIGSGFIVDPGGLIATNQHVVSNLNANYKVITESGDEYDVVEIVRDDVNDIAILRIEATGLNPIELGDSEALVAGQTVVAIGTPLGEYAGSVTTGIISGLNRSVSTSDGSFLGTVKTFEDVIQTDAAINPGNSGGPLLNSSGEVIGVNFATSSGADNISFALPINRVKDRLEEYRAFGKFIKPFVGVEYQMISEADASYYEDLAPGAFVRNVVPAGPAMVAGIKQGDIITKINGEPVLESFVGMIQDLTVGDDVEMEVLRDGEYVVVTVVLGEAE